MDICPICKQYVFDWEKHKCPPNAFECRLHEYGDIWGTVYAYDSGAALDKYCEDNFSNWEYPSNFEVEIRKAGTDGPIELYDVEVQPVPEFIFSLSKTVESEPDLETEE